jgi:hypothetical protein
MSSYPFDFPVLHPVTQIRSVATCLLQAGWLPFLRPFLTLRASDLRVRRPAHLSAGWILTIKAETLCSFSAFPAQKSRLFVVFPATM